jgi:hypothetical protein
VLSSTLRNPDERQRNPGLTHIASLMRATFPCEERSFAAVNALFLLLAERTRHECLGPTFAIVGRAAAEQDLRGAFLLRLGVEALASRKPLASARHDRCRVAIRAASG